MVEGEDIFAVVFGILIDSICLFPVYGISGLCIPRMPLRVIGMKLVLDIPALVNGLLLALTRNDAAAFVRVGPNGIFIDLCYGLFIYINNAL